MKKRHSINHSVKRFVKMIKEGEMVFNYPIQRTGDQWSNHQKSLLIHSILMDYAVPAVHSVGLTVEDGKGEEITIYSIIDGKQRLTSIEEFVSNKFELGHKTPNVVIGKEVYEIRGLTFSKLPEILRDAILDYDLLMYYFINCSDQELSDMFYRLNNGTPLSPQQKAKAKMGIRSAENLYLLANHRFMTENAHFAGNQRKRADDEQVIVQAMMIMDEEYVFSSFGSRQISNYARLMKFDKERLFHKILMSMNYLSDALGDYTDPQVLKKTNLPILIDLGYKMYKDEVDKKLFLEWIADFKLALQDKSDIKINYNEYTGTGSVSSKKVIGRTKEMENHFNQFMKKRLNN